MEGKKKLIINVYCFFIILFCPKCVRVQFGGFWVLIGFMAQQKKNLLQMQCHYLYITHHALRVVNATISYRVKHGIVDNDMV